MRLSLGLFLGLLFWAFASASCSSSGGGDGSSGAPSEGIALELSVTGTIGASASQIQLSRNGGAPSEVYMDPPLPWSLKTSADPGESLRLEVFGLAPVGTLRAEIADDPSIVTTPNVYAQQSCTASATPCVLDVDYSF